MDDYDRLQKLKASAEYSQSQTVFKFHALVPVIIVFVTTTYLTVGLRIYTRTRWAKLWWDDWLMGLTLICFTVFCSCTLAMFLESRGAASIEEIPFHSTEDAVRLLLASEVFYILTMVGLKLSLGFFFFRILATQWQRWLIISAVSTSTAFGIAYLFFAIFQCGYFEHIDIFILRMVSGRCASKALGMGMNYTYSLLGTISDWTCGLVPIFLLKDSNMPKKTKAVVCGLLAFASIGSIASIVRMIYLGSITVPTGNFFKNTSKLAIWSTIEPGIGITVASIACLRRLFQCIFTDSELLGVRSRQNSWALGAASPRTRAGISCTTTIRQVHSRAENNATRIESNATTVFGSMDASKRGSVGEKSMAEEMRAYGLADFDECVNVTQADVENFVDEGEAEIFPDGRRRSQRWSHGAFNLDSGSTSGEQDGAMESGERLRSCARIR